MEVRTMLTMLAQYGGGGSGGNGGGGISYGPGFWIVVAIAAVALVGLVAWLMSRRRGRAGHEMRDHASDRTDRAA
jgi:uncharacterized membrane protein